MVVVFGEEKVRLLLDNSLTRREKEVLMKLRSLTGRTHSALARKLEDSVPSSTTKYVLKNLRKKGLVTFEKGSNVRLTNLGRFFYGGSVW